MLVVCSSSRIGMEGEVLSVSGGISQIVYNIFFMKLTNKIKQVRSTYHHDCKAEYQPIRRSKYWPINRSKSQLTCLTPYLTRSRMIVLNGIPGIMLAIILA